MEEKAVSTQAQEDQRQGLEKLVLAWLHLLLFSAEKFKDGFTISGFRDIARYIRDNPDVAEALINLSEDLITELWNLIPAITKAIQRK